jgi:uncharacterized protein YlxW (UPF0749 family)
MKIARNVSMTMICILLGIMLAVQYKSINYNQSMASFDNKRVDELKDELIKLNEQKSSLQDKLKELEKDNQTYANAKAGDSAAAQQIKDDLNKAKIFAGLLDVKGKGIVVTLDNNAFIHVEDYDVLNVVNELRAAGAQAISVNDERVVAMTEIREAGQYIMINGKQFEAPFIIKAISDPDDLERSLTLIGGVVEILEDAQLNVSIKKADEVVIKQFVDDGTTIKTNLLKPSE